LVATALANVRVSASNSAGAAHRRPIDRRQRGRLAQDQLEHRGHAGERGDAIAADRLDVQPGVEACHQHQRGARRQPNLDPDERVLVVERRRDIDAVLGREAADAREERDLPRLASMAEAHALRPPRRTRRVRLQAQIGGAGRDGGERSRLEEFPVVTVEVHHRDTGGGNRPVRGVHEQQAKVRVARDEGERVRGQLDVQRDGHAAGAHGAEEDREIFRTVQRENADAVAGAEPAPDERTRHGVARGVERVVGDFTRPFGTGQIDDRGESAPDVARQKGPDVDSRVCHGRTSTLPNTSRSSSSRMASRVSASGNTQ
jgi:hypothetical protein